MASIRPSYVGDQPDPRGRRYARPLKQPDEQADSSGRTGAAQPARAGNDRPNASGLGPGSNRLLASRLAGSLFSGPAGGFEGFWALGGLAYVVTGCRTSFLGPGGPSGTGVARLGNTSRTVQLSADVLEPRRIRAGVSRAGPAGFSQGRWRSAARGRASLSWVCATIRSQVHRSGRLGSTDLRTGPAERPFSEPEGVFKEQATMHT